MHPQKQNREETRTPNFGTAVTQKGILHYAGRSED